MAVADGAKIHVFYTKDRHKRLYIRTGELNIFDAKFHALNVKINDFQEIDAIDRYIKRISVPEMFLPLLDKEVVTWKDILGTNAMPDFIEVEVKDGWIYSNIYNETYYERFMLFFKRKVYTTTLYKGVRHKKITSYKPITDQSVLFLV